MMNPAHKKGTALFIVLATILIIVVLANVILAIISSQSRLTHHQVSRIQAQYAAQAGLVYTLEQLRLGNWKVDPSSDKYACMFGCIDSVTPTYIIPADNDLKYQIQVKIWKAGTGNSPQGTARLDAKVNYTYTP